MEPMVRYRQTCHGCAVLLCRGQSSAWSELFPPQILRLWRFHIATPEGTIITTAQGSYRTAHETMEATHGPWVDGGPRLTHAAEVNPDGTTRPMVLSDIDDPRAYR